LSRIPCIHGNFEQETKHHKQTSAINHESKAVLRRQPSIQGNLEQETKHP
jgi:hypothetical protein